MVTTLQEVWDVMVHSLPVTLENHYIIYCYKLQLVYFGARAKE